MPKIKALTPVPGTKLAPALATQVFDQVDKFAGYGFNKSHAAAYAVIAFQTAYLKRHFPHEFFAASMNIEIGTVEKIAAFHQEAKNKEIRILPPDVNQSDVTFTVQKSRDGQRKAVRYALAGLRGTGVGAMQAIVAERKTGGPFKSFQDFVRRTAGLPNMNKKGYESLIKGGALDPLNGKNRAQMLAGLERQMKEALAEKESQKAQQVSMFDLLQTGPVETPLPKVPEMNTVDRLTAEFETLGLFFSGHPLDAMAPWLQKSRALTIAQILDPERQLGRGEVRVGALVTKMQIKMTRKKDPMAILTVSDPSGMTEALAFGEDFERIRERLQEKQSYLFSVSVNAREGEERRLFVRGLEPMPVLETTTRPVTA